MEEIKEFIGEYAYMDADYEAHIEINGMSFLCAEAAYQAERMRDKSMRHVFCGLSGKEARVIGMFTIEQEDWDKVKKEKIFEINLEKFKQNNSLAEKLIETKNIPITNPFLGEALMKIRDIIGSTKYEVNDGVI